MGEFCPRCSEMHRRAQQAEKLALAENKELRDKVARYEWLDSVAKDWADKHLTADWATIPNSGWWACTSSIGRASLRGLLERIIELEARDG